MSRMKIRRKINYDDYKKAICGLAWKWARRTGADPWELMAEGNLAFVEASQKFNPGKAGFITFLYRFINTRFYNLFAPTRRMEIDRIPRGELDEYIVDDCPSPEREAEFKEALSRLGGDSKEVVSCALETPRDLAWMLGRKKSKTISSHTLEKYFTVRRSWTHERYLDSRIEIKGALRALV